MSYIYIAFTSILVNLSIVSCENNSQVTLANLTDVQEGTAVATFAGGCFWCTEAVFERLVGVKDVVSGYTGGKIENPTYKQVSYGETEHAEAVQIYYDPKLVSYQELMEVFFATHDPTQFNRQGPDVGKQYRTAIFYHNEEQRKLSEAYIKKLNSSGKYSREIVTQLNAYDKFYIAEDYHQNYYELNPGNPYIIGIAKPKVKKFKKLFPDKVKPKYK